MRTPFAGRRKALQEKLAAAKIDALLVTRAANWYYLTGFTGDSGALLISSHDTVLMTDGRFTVQSGEETSGVRIVLQKTGLYESLAELLKAGGAKRIGFDPTQISVAQMSSLRRGTGQGRQWVKAGGIVEQLRMKKEPEELAAMRKAALLAGEVMLEAAKMLRVGVREPRWRLRLSIRCASAGPAERPSRVSWPLGRVPRFPTRALPLND